MSLFALWIKAVFVIALAFPLYSETTFVPMPGDRPMPDCRPYIDRHDYCTRELDPICATDGRTYGNECNFCTEKKRRSAEFGFVHFGNC